METRPRLHISLTPADKAVETLGWIFLAILWGITLFSYFAMPETVPIHFNASGEADNYGNKATLLILPIIGTVLFVGMTKLNKYPHIFNYLTEINEANALKQYTNATRMIRYLKLAIAIIFTAIILMMYLNVSGKADGLGTWFLPVMLGLIFIPMTYFLIKSLR